MLSIFSPEHYMRVALQEAQKAYALGEIPVGAVVVCQQQIIAKAHNQTEMLQDVSAHAEMLAMTAANQILGNKYLNECELYVTLEPCIMCAGALAWSQLGKLVIGASDAKRGFNRFSPSVLHPKTVVMQDVLADECADLLKQFFKERR